jgi:predicted amidohydrolase
VAVGVVVGIIGVAGTVAAALVDRSGESDQTTSKVRPTRAIAIRSFDLTPAGPGASVLRVRGAASGLASDERVYAIATPKRAVSVTQTEWFVSPAAVPDRRGLWAVAIKVRRAVAEYTVIGVRAALPPSACRPYRCSVDDDTAAQRAHRLREKLAIVGPTVARIRARSRPVVVPRANSP